MNTHERDLQSIYSTINAIATGKHQPFTEQLLADMMSQKIIELRLVCEPTGSGLERRLRPFESTAPTPYRHHEGYGLWQNQNARNAIIGA